MGAPKPETLARRDKIKQEAFLEAFRKYKTIGGALKATGIHRTIYDRWKDNDEMFLHRVQEIENEFNEVVESYLWQHIKERNLTAIIFWLKYRHGKFYAKHLIAGDIKVQKKLSDEEKEFLQKVLQTQS